MKAYWKYRIVLVVAVVGYTVTVFGMGYYAALKPMRKLALAMRDYCLGDHLTRDELDRLATVYLNPGEMRHTIENVVFDPFKSYAPFVGDVPSPFVPHPSSVDELPCYRIIITGGSTAYGSGAPSEETTIGGYLQHMLNDDPPHQAVHYEVLTCASTAWSTTHERIATVNLLSQWQPDLIISLSGANDVYHGSLGRNVNWFRTPAEENFFHLLRLTLKKTTGRTMEDVVANQKSPVEPELVAQRLMTNIHVIQHVLSGDEIEYLFALQPTLFTTAKQLAPREKAHIGFQTAHTTGYFTRCYDLFRSEIGAEEGPFFHFLDLTSVFDESSSEPVFIDSFHFGDKGNKIIASALCRYIREHYSLPSN